MANNGSSAPPPAGPSTVKKGKNKKTDPVDTNKLVEQTMARLERDMAGDREQEAEIGTYVAVHYLQAVRVSLQVRTLSLLS